MLTFLTALVAMWAIDSARFEGKVARNVSVSGYDVSGLSPTELSVVLQDISSTYSSTPVIIKLRMEKLRRLPVLLVLRLTLCFSGTNSSSRRRKFGYRTVQMDKESFHGQIVKCSSLFIFWIKPELISTIVSEQPVPIEPKWKVEEGVVVSLPGIPAKAFNLDTIQDDVGVLAGKIQ